MHASPPPSVIMHASPPPSVIMHASPPPSVIMHASPLGKITPLNDCNGGTQLY